MIDTPSAVDKMKQNDKGVAKPHNAAATYSVALRKVDPILFGHSTGRHFSPALRAHGITTSVSFLGLDVKRVAHPISVSFKRGIVSHHTRRHSVVIVIYREHLS